MVAHPSDATGLTGYACSFALPAAALSPDFNTGDGMISESIVPIPADATATGG